MQQDSTVIYRIQDNDGRGPWKPGFSHKWVVVRPDHDNLIPWYVEHEGIINELCNYAEGEYIGTGCLNTEQLKRWFTKNEYKWLLRYGYKAVEISDAEVIAESDIQCVFKRLKPLNLDIKKIRLY
jgi:hypothetical protein